MLISLASPEPSPIMLLTPTGVAAFNIQASTIHFALNLPIKDLMPLEGNALAKFQEELRHIRYILIDEMSFSAILMNVFERHFHSKETLLSVAVPLYWLVISVRYHPSKTYLYMQGQSTEAHYGTPSTQSPH